MTPNEPPDDASRRPARPTTQQIRIGARALVETPSFAAEIVGWHDLIAMADHQRAIAPGQPLVGHPHTWDSMISRPAVVKRQRDVARLVRDHPIIFMDPPELFRYRVASKFRGLVMGNNTTLIKAFNSDLRAGKFADAISKLDPFYRPFAMRLLPQLAQEAWGGRDKAAAKMSYESATAFSPAAEDAVTSAWADPLVNKHYQDFTIRGVELMLRYGGTYVPPVQVIDGEPTQRRLDRIRGMNTVVSRQAQALAADGAEVELLPYFHLYLAPGFFKSSGESQERVLDELRDALNRAMYGGVALTISGWEDLYLNGKAKTVDSFIDDAVIAADRFGLPVMLPRSGPYGARQTDSGVSIWTGLLKGEERLKSGGGGKAETPKHGRVYCIELARPLGPEEVINILRTNGQLPPMGGLPRRPQVFNPSGSTVEECLGSAGPYTDDFARPSYLAPYVEAQRFRTLRAQGDISPAREYTRRSDVKALKDL